MGADHSLIVGYGVPKEKLYKYERRDTKEKLFDNKTGEPYEKDVYRWYCVTHDGREVATREEPYSLFRNLSFGDKYVVLSYSNECEDGGRVYNDLEVEIPDLPLKPDEIQIERLVVAGIPLEVARDAKLMAIVHASY